MIMLATVDSGTLVAFMCQCRSFLSPSLSAASRIPQIGNPSASVPLNFGEVHNNMEADNNPSSTSNGKCFSPSSCTYLFLHFSTTLLILNNMAVVVEQTLPFSSKSLDLENASRWTSLFPLIRPSVKEITTTKGQKILVDTALASSKFVHIIAFANPGSLSSKILDEKHITAIVTETSGAGILTAPDLPHALQSAGIEVTQGVVAVRADKKREIINHAPGVIEVITEGDLECDHLLHVLGSAVEGIRMNPHNVAELLKNFVKSARTTHSKFHTEKADGNPSITHSDGVAGYDKAKFAVQKDLKSVLKNLEISAEEEVVHSVHYSDLNGLSRLENYIIAGEVARFLGESNLNAMLAVQC